MNKLTDQQHKDRKARVINLLKQPGWRDILDLFEEQLKIKEHRLRECTDYELDKIQGFIKGLEFIFKKVDNIIKGETDGGRETIENVQS